MCDLLSLNAGNSFQGITVFRIRNLRKKHKDISRVINLGVEKPILGIPVMKRGYLKDMLRIINHSTTKMKHSTNHSR